MPRFDSLKKDISRLFGYTSDMEMEQQASQYGVNPHDIHVSWYSKARRWYTIFGLVLTCLLGGYLQRTYGTRQGLGLVVSLVLGFITLFVMMPLWIATNIERKRRFHQELPDEFKPVYRNKVKSRVIELITLFFIFMLAPIIIFAIVALIAT